LGKNRGNHGILPGNSWEKNMGKTLFFWVFLGKNNGILGKKHEKTWEHWKTLLVFLVFPVVRFSDIPWEVAHCFLTVSTKYSMVKKAAHGFSGGQIFPSEFTFTNWSDFP
jgi:hypothetical protein